MAYTASALVVGIWQFLAIIDALERHTTAELQEIADEFLRLLGSESNFRGCLNFENLTDLSLKPDAIKARRFQRLFHKFKQPLKVVKELV